MCQWQGGGRAWPAVRAAPLGAPRTFWLIFLPLHNAAQILSFVSINWEDEGAGRLALSSGLAFISLSAGTCNGHMGHPIQNSPHPIHTPELCSLNLKSEIFPMKLPFFLFWSPAILFPAFSHQCAVFPLGTHGIQSLEFPSSS